MANETAKSFIFNLDGLTVAEFHQLMVGQVTANTDLYLKVIKQWIWDRPINAETLLEMDIFDEYPVMVKALLEAVQEKMKAEVRLVADWDLTKMGVGQYEVLSSVSIVRADFLTGAEMILSRLKNRADFPDKPVSEWLYFEEWLAVFRGFGQALKARQKK